eukprot:359290-Chlamydomonas_euryale.AAC.9
MGKPTRRRLLHAGPQGTSKANKAGYAIWRLATYKLRGSGRNGNKNDGLAEQPPACLAAT